MTTFADYATEGSFVIAAGIAGLGVVKMWLRDVQRDTIKLQHNGGTSVADTSRDARDSSLRTERMLNEHLIDSAARHAKQDALIGILLAERTMK